MHHPRCRAPLKLRQQGLGEGEVAQVVHRQLQLEPLDAAPQGWRHHTGVVDQQIQPLGPCRHAGRGILGVIAIPALDELVYAAVDAGAWHSRGGGTAVPARVSSRATLGDGLCCTSDFTSFGRRADAAGRSHDPFHSRRAPVRRRVRTWARREWKEIGRAHV